MAKPASIFLLLLLLPIFTWAASPAIPRDETARQVFVTASGKILQIRVILKSTGSQATLGSGFVVDRQGAVVTNYHVISRFAMDPDRYRIEYLGPSLIQGSLTLSRFDVVNDLAVLRMDKPLASHLNLHDGEPSQGERVFSMGNPLDLGLTIVEGTYNGQVGHSLYQKIHFTGAINSGMSGGPALTRDGRVFGVNVSVHRRGQLVSFLIPIGLAQPLLRATALPATESGDVYRREIRDQLLANQARYMKKVLATPLKAVKLGDYSAPDRPGNFMRCWGSSENEPRKYYEVAAHSCFTEDSLFVNDTVHTGYIGFNHSLFKSRSLGPFRFYGLYQQRFAEDSAHYGTKEEYTRFRCHDDFVALGDQTMFVAVCAREYRRLPGLYDVAAHIATLDSTEQGLQSHLTLTGVSYDNAMRYVRNYLETFSWRK